MAQTGFRVYLFVNERFETRKAIWLEQNHVGLITYPIHELFYEIFQGPLVQYLQSFENRITTKLWVHKFNKGNNNRIDMFKLKITIQNIHRNYAFYFNFVLFNMTHIHVIMLITI